MNDTAKVNDAIRWDRCNGSDAVDDNRMMQLTRCSMRCDAETK